MSDHAVTSEPSHGPDSAPRRDPFVLDVRSLGRRPGTMSEVHRTVATPDKLGVEMIGIPAGSDVDLDLRLESVSEGILVTGTACGETAGQCSRCLEPIDGTVTVFLTELFAYPDSVTEQTTEEDDVHRIVDDRIDLEQAIIDAVALELPMSPLCSPDCPGLCQVCGIRLAVAEPGHAHELIDPRWAGLANKFSELTGDDKPDGDTSDGDTSDGDKPGDQERRD
ncbi:metal-binding protein [Gordonia sp. 1D]|nr:metal-binding protein [Gordonia sp. 1D]